MNGRIDAADTVLFGSTNGTTPGVAYMRWGRRTFANCRPIRWRPGFRSPLARPEGIDYVIVRENLEDTYIGVMGDADALRNSGLIGPRARLAYDGPGPLRRQDHHPGRHREGRPLLLELARRRPARSSRCRPRRTCCPRPTATSATSCAELAQDYPDVAYEQFIVDDMAHRLVVPPRRARRPAAAQPLRRRPLRRGRGHDRRARPGAERLLRRRLRLLRVRPRHRPRHRRPAPHQPDRHAAHRR